MSSLLAPCCCGSPACPNCQCLPSTITISGEIDCEGGNACSTGYLISFSLMLYLCCSENGLAYYGYPEKVGETQVPGMAFNGCTKCDNGEIWVYATLINSGNLCTEWQLLITSSVAGLTYGSVTQTSAAYDDCTLACNCELCDKGVQVIEIPCDEQCDTNPLCWSLAYEQSCDLYPVNRLPGQINPELFDICQISSTLITETGCQVIGEYEISEQVTITIA